MNKDKKLFIDGVIEGYRRAIKIVEELDPQHELDILNIYIKRVELSIALLEGLTDIKHYSKYSEKYKDEDTSADTIDLDAVFDEIDSEPKVLN